MGMCVRDDMVASPKGRKANAQMYNMHTEEL